jgi:hypothetical protein
MMKALDHGYLRDRNVAKKGQRWTANQLISSCARASFAKSMALPDPTKWSEQMQTEKGIASSG